jgi:hypothetical protein
MVLPMVRFPASEVDQAGDQVLDPRKATRAGSVLLWVLCYALLATFLYFYGLHSHWGNADLVRGIIQGSDMAKGNVLLKYWYSGSDNFLTIDLVFFTVGVLIFGAKVALLHYVSSLVWAGVALAAVYIASVGITGWARLLTITVVVGVLVLPCPLLAQQLSQSMMHVATTLYILLGFIALRDGRFGRGWVIGVVLLTASTFGDPLTIVLALVPALAVGVLESVRERSWRFGLPLSSAALAAFLGAKLLRVISVHLGSFKVSATASLQPGAAITYNLHTILPDVVSLFGLGISLHNSGVPWELEIFRTIGLLVALLGLLVAVGCLLIGLISRQPRTEIQGMTGRSEASFRLSDLLLVAALGSAACYIMLGQAEASLRYLAPGVVFAVILGAMSVGQFAQQLSRLRIRQWISMVAFVSVGCCAASVAVILAEPVPASPYSGLVGSLLSHHLYRGVGDYWTSAPVTVYSDGRVTVRPVTETVKGSGLEPYLVLSKSTWYKGRFQFLVYNFDESAYGTNPEYGVAIHTATKFPFFPVAYTYRYHSFRVVVWKTPEKIGIRG